ncbi:TPA: hypothetical protein DIU27_04665 [Candidatus Collierbacteria bacterium]|uniref:Uncharacterized protein n=1 Tax=Candidatus Collierbacteria bacterium GW2011_GWB2_44_22 TaxID=1618387 RepID=A0A0G1K610_9BACT|nr:MAG: hypothetical protein UW31_C0011G0003 [Candidatus Collierbacteria bacterium GW2011_GWA2_44_13]KKT51757.1 MAG: hypothetical protein UW44_C0008G0079 [Candidatus Collierbacteria bacterium GW2011_GWB2_44_22]KKT68293.1 MAG: hypothetical protein UW64_C0023G0009 [Microgenomates group bacterium GW2011_GWC1_44_37]KKT87982.1 MAG: hypothetical protein UW88_C0017G0003 [Candidatus Collierbacteria bacterium GW2011_GWD2_45_10]HCQ31641.1 hypothetical protein [Candidatus Collierbacteria bacterium]
MDSSYQYDSYEAIYESLKSLATFNALLEARHRAGYERHERLKEWVILGRFSLDTCGNTLKFTGENIPAEMLNHLHAVMTQDDFNSYIKLRSEGQDIWFSSSIGSGIPPAHIVCPECKEPWAVSNCHDVVVEHESRVVKLDGYCSVAATLGMIKELWLKNGEAIWRVQPDCSIRNDRYIDHSIRKDELGQKYQMQKNENGWIAPDDNYRIQSGDEAMVNIWTYRHHRCHRINQLTREQEYFEKIFAEAGYKKVKLAYTPNQYCPCDSCAPWFKVVADGISFTIGWRKRVINIESTNSRIDFTKLFQSEDVTKSTHGIHAWGREKCIEYLTTIRKIVK